MKLTGGQIVCESLLQEGVTDIFGLPGGAMLPLYGTLPQYPQINHILVRHEQGAAIAADGYARATGNVGVCWATSGPGATNLVTGLANAMMDSVPLVAITGQVGRPAIGKDAFQETDVTGVTLPVTKHNYLVMHASEISGAIKEAFYIARTGRPGPVLVDIPKDVFTEVAEFVYPDSVDLPGYRPAFEPDVKNIETAAEILNSAKRPVILAGHGVILSKASSELRELAEKAQIPVITTLLGISSFPESHILSMGMPGMHGVAWASYALHEADVILSLGARFDDRVTGDLRRFAPDSKKIHFDIDAAEIGKTVSTSVGVVGDLKLGVQKLIPMVNQGNHPEWIRRIEQLRDEHPSLQIRKTSKLLPQYILKKISEITESKAIIVTGVGQHQMWAAQHCAFEEPGTLITSGGLGTMGFEVPAAMGAKVARPDKVVWSIAGDGGFQMTLSELATIAENNIDVKFAILNNNFLGMVRQWQEFFYESEYTATHYTGNPDFVKLADAYGLVGIRVEDAADVEGAIRQAMNTPGAVIVDFMVEQEENVFPMIPAGESIYELMEEPSEIEEPV
ncbi:MAG: acetolactate synthase, large subunit, biosynthetic type [Chloroflexi bacterium]|nr:acetolactate synthase, large subunit, biosynthetic type [Chloroflexota bacterium]|tara:strand:- start:2797 stop:4491 length:1695 start_codon:yes stop_codon:yes gene_type:complete